MSMLLVPQPLSVWMRSNGIIIMVLSGLENQRQCWKGLTVSSPDWNTQRKASVINSVLLLPPLCSPGLQLTPRAGISGGSQWCLPHPAKQLEKRQSPGYRWLGMTLHDHREPGAHGELGWRHSTLGAAATVDPAPWAMQGQGKPRNARLLLPGGKKDCSYYFL